MSADKPLPQHSSTSLPVTTSSNSHFDIEAQRPHSPAQPRFVYSHASLARRLLVGARVKTKLDTSKIVRIQYRVFYKYVLILTMILIGAFLTPRFLPKSLGFQWASGQDICQASDEKLDAISRHIQNVTRLRESQNFLNTQKATLDCMNKSSSDFYNGPDANPARFQWPQECTSEIAKVSLTETTCVSQSFNTCSGVGAVGGFFLNILGSCKDKEGPDLCTESSNADRGNALVELERERDLANLPNVTTEVEPILSTANSRIQNLISRLTFQADIAADAFILYSIISIAVGLPLVVCKREKGSRIVGAALGMTKLSFIIAFIVIMSIYDSAAAIVKETNFTQLFENFMNDPCYIDPQFSQKRGALILDACNNVSSVALESDVVLRDMDRIYYDTRLFGFCADGSRELAVHPKLSDMDDIRAEYRSGKLQNPGRCNATELDQQTSIAPSDEKGSKFRALLRSGILAQLMLKFIVTGWVLHLIAFIEPMVLHGGKVEVWSPKCEADLTKEESNAVRRFARDKQLLPLILFSVMLLIEISLIIYSMSTPLTDAKHISLLDFIILGVEPEQSFSCPLV